MTTFSATVSVVNGSNAVDLVNAFVTGNLEVGDLLVLGAAPTIAWTVASLGTADSPPSPQRFYLSANFAGATNSAAAAEIVRDFTPVEDLPLAQPNDLYPWASLNEAFGRIDAAFGDKASDAALTALDGRVTDVETAVAGKADSSAVAAALNGKLDDPGTNGVVLRTGDDGVSEVRAWTDFADATPVFSFATPGTLSVTYHTRSLRWKRVGNLVTAFLYMDFTPTLGTASGIVNITGLPVSVASGTFGGGAIVQLTGSGNNGPVFPTGRTSIAMIIGDTGIALMSGAGSNALGGFFAAGDFTSGNRYVLRAVLQYEAVA